MKPYSQLKFVRTLMQFNGIDFVDLFEDEDGTKIITSWVDLEQGESLWIMFQVTPENLDAYMGEKIPFRTLWQDAPELFLFATTKPEELRQVTFDEVEKYHPTVDSFFNDMFAAPHEDEPPTTIH